MRFTLPLTVVVAASVAIALAPRLATAAPATGFPAITDCTDTVRNIDTDAAELYVLKITPTASQRETDWIWNIERKAGESNSDAQALLDGGGFWSTGDVWALPQAGPDVAFVYITFANGDIYVDNSDGSSVDWGVVPVQRVGDSLPMLRDAGIGLSLPGTAAQYSVTTRPGFSRTLPANNNIGFSPVAEVNPADAVPGACQIAGAGFNPRDPTRGGIIGYNVYRIPGVATTVPTRADFMAAIVTDTDTDGGWVYFMDLRLFDVTLRDTVLRGPAPSDVSPSDLAGLQNEDGRMYSGDEVLMLQDTPSNSQPGFPLIVRPRAADLSPVAGVSYWYAIQPVVVGRMSGYAAADFTVNSLFAGDHRMDLDGDGEFDAVSLDSVAGSHNTPEFISPQAEAENGSLDGMGLTNGGMPLLSAPMFHDATRALPAVGEVVVSGSVQGNAISVVLNTGFETGDVLGYNLYRVAGEERVRVNEKPILAQGAESNAYALFDAATRIRGARSVDYFVEIIQADGSASEMAGPFTVSLSQEASRRRR